MFQQKFYYECLKQESPNVFVCPENENFASENTDNIYLTKMLSKIRDKNKQKKKVTKKKKKKRHQNCKLEYRKKDY